MYCVYNSITDLFITVSIYFRLAMTVFTGGKSYTETGPGHVQASLAQRLEAKGNCQQGRCRRSQSTLTSDQSCIAKIQLLHYIDE